MENRSYAVEIEKGDTELQRLRNKVTSVMQILAQMKEKSYATDEKIHELCELLKYMESKISNVSLGNIALAERHTMLVHTFSMYPFFLLLAHILESSTLYWNLC
jgi:hypothetical protein